MPTGYTVDIPKGISFTEYAMRCARAFGALITLREEPLDAEIPDEFEPSDYNLKRYEEAKAEVDRLRSMSQEEVKAAAEEAYQAAEEHRISKLKKNGEEQAAYAAMLERVNAWQPPSPDHVEMKEFMASQITESMRFDDMADYYAKPTERMTGEQWRVEMLKKALRDVGYHWREHQQEVERAQSRTEWVSALRASLKENKS